MVCGGLLHLYQRAGFAQQVVPFFADFFVFAGVGVQGEGGPLDACFSA